MEIKNREQFEKLISEALAQEFSEDAVPSEEAAPTGEPDIAPEEEAEEILLQVKPK